MPLPTADAGSNDLQLQTQHSRCQHLTNHCCSFSNSFFSELKFEIITSSFKAYFRKSPHNTPLQLPRDDDAAGSYTCNKPAAPAPASPNSKHLNHQAVSTGIFRCSRQDHAKAPQFTNDILLGLSSALRGHIDIFPVKQELNKPGHLSSSLGNRYVFDRLQQCLLSDHIATPTICTKYRDYPDLLDLLTPKAESTTFDSTDFLHNRDYTDISCTIYSIKTRHLNLPICPGYFSYPPSIIYTKVCRINAFIDPATSIFAVEIL